MEQGPPERPRKRPKQAGEATRKKRGQGEGYIRRRPTGKWHGQLMVGWRMVKDPDTGLPVAKKDVRSVTRNTRQEVVAALAEFRRQYEAGVLPDANRMTLADLLERWLRTFVRSHRSAKTAQQYADAVRNHLIPRLGAARLTQLSPLRLTGAINEIAAGGLAKNTVASIYTALSSALTWAVKMRLLRSHPLQGLERPPRAASIGRVLTPDELHRLLEAARTYRAEGGGIGRWWPVFTLMAYTGLTTGEALALTWGDVLLPNILRVGAAARHRPRQVPLSPSGIEALRLARVIQQRQQVGIGTENWPWRPDPESVWPVFTSESGRPVERRRAQEAFGRLVQLAGIDGYVRPHDLRHTFNTVAAAGGHDVRLRSQHLGHTVAINQSTYTHPDLAQQAQMAEDVERRLRDGHG